MNHTQSRWRLLVAAAACAIACGGLTGPPVLAQSAPPEPWITTSSAELRTTHGQDWLRVRDAALSRPEFEGKALVAWLDSPARMAEERTLARILRTRLERPDVAAEFDTAVAKSLTDPETGHSGKPVYSQTMPRLTEVNGPLAIEHLWKRTDLPARLRWDPLGCFASEWDYVEPMLVILGENPSLGGSIAHELGRMAHSHPDPRVVPALLENYRYARANKPDDMEHAHRVMAWTAILATPEAAAAVLQMRDIERAGMQARGLAPWDDQEADEAQQQRLLALGEAFRHEHEPGGKDRLAEAEQRLKEATERNTRRRYWEEIEAKVAELRAKGLIGEDQQR